MPTTSYATTLMTPMNPRIIFMGTQGLAETVLERLIQSETYKPILVIAQPDKPVGRKQIIEPVPVKMLAQKHAIAVWQPDTLKDADAIKRMRTERPDCIIVASYGKLIPQEIIDIPPHGILNVHASLLPQYRGASPVQRAVLNGDSTTGVTIMRIDSGLDTGDIVSQESCLTKENETTETLMRKLAELGSSLLLKTLHDWLEGKIIPQKQDNSHATAAPLFTKNDGLVLKEHDAQQIERMIRALAPWPGTYLVLKNGKKIAIKKAQVTSCAHEEYPALTMNLTPEKQLTLHTARGCLILEEVQPEGKKPMSGYDFYLGNKDSL